MPQMDGIELIRELSKNSFDGVVLVLSNYTDFELVREALTAGALDYIIKVKSRFSNITTTAGKSSK